MLQWHPGEFTCAIYLGHVADDLQSQSLPTPFETWTTTLNIPVPGSDTRMRMNLWVEDHGIALPTQVTINSIHWQSLPTCSLGLRETPTGNREIVLALGNVDAGSLYSLSLTAFTTTFPFFEEVPLPVVIPATTIVVPFPDLPSVVGVVGLESTLISPEGVACRDSLLYDVAEDRVLKN